MNDRFFACSDCKTYINAGGRWCRWTLEDEGILRWRQPVDVGRLLDHSGYWNLSADENGRSWLKVLAPVRPFLETHREHHVIFLTDDDLWNFGEDPLLEWLQVGWNAGWTPRHFIEVLGMTRWGAVEQYILDHGESDEAGWWRDWLDESERERFRLKFEALAGQV